MGKIATTYLTESDPKDMAILLHQQQNLPDVCDPAFALGLSPA